MKMKKTNLSYSLIVIVMVFAFSIDVLAGKRISLSEMQIELKSVNQEQFGLIIWDQRPQVKDGSQPESFLGYLRTFTQIHYPKIIEGDYKLTDVLLEQIVSAYLVHGVKVSPIKSSTQESEGQIYEKASNYEQGNVLLLKLNDFFFTGVSNMEYIVDVEVILLNKETDILYEEEIDLTFPMGKATKLKKIAPVSLQTIMEDILNDSQTIGAIEKDYTASDTSNPLSECDIIFTNEGEEIEAKVVEISSEEIKYKQLSNLDGPLRVINISDVFMIKYKNGQKEVFK